MVAAGVKCTLPRCERTTVTRQQPAWLGYRLLVSESGMPARSYPGAWSAPLHLTSCKLGMLKSGRGGPPAPPAPPDDAPVALRATEIPRYRHTS